MRVRVTLEFEFFNNGSRSYQDVYDGLLKLEGRILSIPWTHRKGSEVLHTDNQVFDTIITKVVSFEGAV